MISFLLASFGGSVNRFFCLSVLGALCFLWGCEKPLQKKEPPKVPKPSLLSPKETHLKNARQLTFGGENAEAYFSNSGQSLIFQHTGEKTPCDQIFTMDLQGENRNRVSNGQGRTTCSYFLPGDKRVIFASTHGGSPDCPPPPDQSQGYVWALYKDYDLYLHDLGSSTYTPFLPSRGYDAEATVSPDGQWIVFTSERDGDLELYKVRTDGSQLTSLTSTPGYDGGAFFSPDSSRIVYRAHHPKGPALQEYQRLLGLGLIRPSTLEIFTMASDGTDIQQVTHLNSASFCPYYSPDGKKIIFSSNYGDPSKREFDLFLINADGSDLERVTDTPEFDGFPMFSADGKSIVWGSNRKNNHPHDTNIFWAKWVP